MREKKNAILISTIVAFFSLFCAIIFLIKVSVISEENNSLVLTYEFISNAFLGVFASSIATLFIFICEYRTERSLTIKKVCQHVFRVHSLLQRITYVRYTNSEHDTLEKYTQKHGFKNILEEICDLYYEAVKEHFECDNAFTEIDFFLDFPLKEWIKNHIFVRVPSFIQRQVKNKKLALAEAKAIYLEEHTSGKRKKVIENLIRDPMRDLFMIITPHARNELDWYRKGYSQYQDEALKSIIEMQKELWYSDKNGSVTHKQLEWFVAAQDLYKTIYHSKLFWIKYGVKKNDNSKKAN